MKKIIPFLWFDTNAQEAVDLYSSLFSNSKISAVTKYGEGSPLPSGTVMTIAFTLEGEEFVALNGGPYFKFNPAISLFVNCETAEEVDRIWNGLSDGGSVLMEMGEYPFSKKFGWLQDKYGLTWQVSLGHSSQKITPSLLFTGKQYGKAEEAISQYVSCFSNSQIISIQHNEISNDGLVTILTSKFSLGGFELRVTDSGYDHGFTFNEAFSFVVNCDTQQEIDWFWEQLSKGGEEGQCGWLKDRFGVSWQVIPSNMGTMINISDPEKSKKFMTAMLKMKKLIIAELEEAIK